MRRGALITISILLTLLALNLYADTSTDLFWRALQRAQRPPTMPNLEEYRRIANGVAKQGCLARINYVAVYGREYDVCIDDNNSYCNYFTYLDVLDVLTGEKIAILVYMYPYDFGDRDISILRDWVNEFGSGVFMVYAELDEDLYTKGYIYSRNLYIPFNSTHIVNVTGFIDDSYFHRKKIYYFRDYLVYCPNSQVPVVTETITVTFTEAKPVTVERTLTTTFERTLTTTVEKTLTETLTVEKERVSTETKTATATMTVTARDTITLPVTVATTFERTLTTAIAIPVTLTVTSMAEKEVTSIATITVTTARTFTETFTVAKTVEKTVEKGFSYIDAVILVVAVSLVLTLVLVFLVSRRVTES